MPKAFPENVEVLPSEPLPLEDRPLEADEQAFEASPESKEIFLEDASTTKLQEAAKVIEGAASSSAASIVKTSPKDEVEVAVEKILEEDLGDLYSSLPASAKPLFKQKGEQVAQEISRMVRTLKIHARRVLQLIRDWLLTIPGVNRFFLEQQAKIKVDKLMEYIRARREDRAKKL